MTPEETFSERIKCARKNKGLNQKDLAILMGVHIGTISHWENGKQLPDSNTIHKLAITLETTISYLLGDNQKDNKTKELKIDELVEKFKALSNASIQIIGPAILAAYDKDEADGTLKK